MAELSLRFYTFMQKVRAFMAASIVTETFASEGVSDTIPGSHMFDFFSFEWCHLI